jgi:hypothetical protein
MDISKKQLKESILIVSTHIREDKSYKELLEISTLPEICKDISCDLFIENITEANVMKHPEVFKSIVMIRKYLQTLKRDGSFDFKSDISGNAGL